MWHEFLRLLLFLLEIGLFVAMFVMYWESLTQAGSCEQGLGHSF